MDEKRRQRENYRSRLMEEHEVPECVYAVPDITKGKLHDDTPVTLTGKRIRKEVIRDDVISEPQFMKAVENGNDKSKHFLKRRRDNNNNIIIINNNTNVQQLAISELAAKSNIVEEKSETVSIRSEGKSEDGYGWGPRRANMEGESSGKSGLEFTEGGLNGLTWTVHRRKRSSLV
ncbi:hypothetical protein CASFOL_005316 [Castilleja foliolosa]|uniref:Snf2 ATP coupling domain-containing protein n=1 Tax=Castilleja foliolosa TaxID=1961234 RepID=A0ABD3E339_9LAMI